MPSGKRFNVIGLAILMAFSTGCSMCSNCDLETYSAYGGRWQRTDRTAGRVGSVFHPAGALVPYGPSASADPNSVLDEEASDEQTENQEDTEQTEQQSENESGFQEASFQDY